MDPMVDGHASAPPRAGRPTPGAGETSPPIDRGHLARYTLGDAALEREVLELFIGNLPKTLMALSVAATDKDWRMAAHTLKGSARAVGAWRLALSAEAAERVSASMDRSAAELALARISDDVAEANAFVTCIIKT